MRCALVILPLLALAACTAGPEYAPPQRAAAPAFARGGDADVATPAARWWDGLGDPTLSGLIDKGLKGAPSIAAAEARVRQARAGLVASRAAQLPAFGTSATYIRADLPPQSFGGDSAGINLFNLGFDAQWEADLWGGKRRGIEKARADADAAAARLADAQVTLSAEIARAYLGLRAREAASALLAERHAAEARIGELARQRVAAGTAPAQVAEAALAQLGRTEGEQAAMTAEIAVLRDSLAVLTGGAPGTLDDLPGGAIPLPPAQVTVGDPAALLARRPDLRAAERRLAAATAQIGVEEAKRFPQVSFMGLIGIGGTSLGDVFDTSRLSTVALPRLSWSFLDFGRSKAAVRGAEAGRDLALAEYDGAVLAALQDAEASLARYGAARIELARAGAAERHAATIASLHEQRAEAGTIALGEALEARRQAIDARLGEVEKRSGLTLAYIAIAKALGLGWGMPQ